jgi:PAS domain S-box-containing protein
MQKKRIKTQISNTLLQENQTDNFFKSLTDQSAEGIVAIDLKGHILYANKTAEKIVNASNGKTIGVHFTKYIHKDSLSKALAAFKQAKKGVSTIRNEVKIVQNKGVEIPVEFTASPIYQAKKINQILIIVQDTTKKLEAEKFAQESNKMRAVQNFILGTAHEIKHPLQGLLHHTENLIGDYKDRDFEYIGFNEFKDIVAKLESMRDQVRYCHDTIERLLNLSQKKVGITNKCCGVNEVIKDVVSSLEHQLAVSDITVKLFLAKDLPKVCMSALEFHQVTLNILTNAIQSMPLKGVIRMRTKYLKKEKIISFECVDEGVGIPKETLKRIYEPFFTTKERGLEKNSGLGLSIVYSIVKSNNGHIVINSSLRSGTSVKLSLSVCKPSKSQKGRSVKK